MAAADAGYIGSVSLLQAIVQVAEKLRQYNPDIVYGAQETCCHLVCLILHVLP